MFTLVLISTGQSWSTAWDDAAASCLMGLFLAVALPKKWVSSCPAHHLLKVAGGTAGTALIAVLMLSVACLAAQACALQPRLWSFEGAILDCVQGAT